jgi:small GTP-binding protein
MKPVDLKVVLVGSTHVGKTCIVHRYVNDFFSFTEKPTLGVAYSARTVNVDSHVVNLQIWDTGGAEKYRSMTPVYYHDARVALVVYSVADAVGFSDVDMWMGSLSEHADEDIVVFLVGNKIDLDGERVIATERGEEKARQYGAHFVEVSAVTGRGIGVEKFLRNAPPVGQGTGRQPSSRDSGRRVGGTRFQAPMLLTGTGHRLDTDPGSPTAAHRSAQVGFLSKT